MQQEILTTQTERSDSAFQQKSTALSLLITIGATVYYIANMLPLRTEALTTGTMPAGFGPLILTTVVLIVIAQIVTQSILSLMAGGTTAMDAHEQAAALKAKRNGYLVLTVGIFGVISSAFWGEAIPFWFISRVAGEPTLFTTANLAILAYALAAIVEYASQLFYSRR